MDVSRRGFLKACAVVSAGALIIPQFKLIEPHQANLLKGHEWVGSVREVAAYDIYSDSIIVRHDIMGPGGDQFCVDQKMFPGHSLADARELSATLLRDQMKHQGWTLRDLRPMPLPPGMDSKLLDGLISMGKA